MKITQWLGKSVACVLLTGWIAVMAGGSAFAAAPAEDAKPVHLASGAESDALIGKQKEIDDYMTGTAGQEELEAQGFSITNTGVTGSKVEVGITPYSEEAAKFLYAKFGSEQVHVVEGVQAVLFNGTASAQPTSALVEENPGVQTSSSASLWITVGAVITVAAGLMIVAGKKLLAKK